MLLRFPEDSTKEPVSALALLTLQLAMPAAPPRVESRKSEEWRRERQHQMSEERARFLRSRKPLDRKKPQRTRSCEALTPSGRDPLQELEAVMGPLDGSGGSGGSGGDEMRTERDEGLLLRLPAPHEHVTLRRLRRRDAPRVQALFTQDMLDHFADGEVSAPGEFPSAVDYLEEQMDQSEWPEAPAPLQKEVRGADEEPGSHKIPRAYAIALDDVLIGCVDINFLDPDAKRSTEVTYWIGDEYQGRGIVTAAVGAFVDWSWRTFDKIERIDAYVYCTWNPGSRRVLQKCGFVSEGVMRRAVWKERKGFSDIEVWAMLRDEWRLSKGLCPRGK